MPVCLRMIQSDLNFLDCNLLLSRFVNSLEHITVGATINFSNYVIFILLVRKLRHVHLIINFRQIK